MKHGRHYACSLAEELALQDLSGQAYSLVNLLVDANWIMYWRSLAGGRPLKRG